MQYWAHYSTAWRLTFGMGTTSAQESMHASIKRHIGARPVHCHEVPLLLDEWVKRRKDKLVLALSTDLLRTKSEYQKQCKNIGCEEIFKALELLLQPSVFSITCTNLLEASTCLAVEEISSYSAYLSLKDTLCVGSSGHRFHLFIESIRGADGLEILI